jgi:glycosyltransferase involved in cell wall biosynthesis
MRLSVLFPVYGEANFVCEAIISTLDDIGIEDELIIVLDRTSDHTRAIIEDFASKDERIVIINSPKPGIVNALNLGMKYSTSDFIARMDADDVVIKGRFHAQKRFLETHPKYILIGSNLQLIDSTGRKIGVKIYPTSHNSIKRMLFFYNSIAHPSIMIRRTSMLEFGLYEVGTEGYEDFYLWRKLIDFGKFRNSRKCFLKYRIHTSQASAQITTTASQHHEFYFDYLKSQNKSINQLNTLYAKLTERKEKKTDRFLIDFKLLGVYIKYLILSPKSTFGLSFYFIINLMISKMYSKSTR